MNPTSIPVACELFAQWQRARGNRTEPASRPFSRGWENLLEDAHLVSGADRNEADRDARLLATNGWIELKTVRYKSHLIEQIILPLAIEMRWREAFGFVPPSDEEAKRIREFPWQPALAFVRDSRVSIPFADLCQLNEFLKNGLSADHIVPVKERSLQIFGDEKRLDSLLNTTIFRPERLSLRKDFRCEVVGEPLPWKRGPIEAANQPVIVIENAATWHSYCRWNAEQKLFSAVIYGCGNRFVDGVRYLGDIFTELGSPRSIFYFGDLDPQGLLIPQEASSRAQAASWPNIEAHQWSYSQLLTLAAGRGQPSECEPASSTLCDWLGGCAEPVRMLFNAGERLAQEHVGWDFLNGKTP